jgi:hypothetical protein
MGSKTTTKSKNTPWAPAEGAIKDSLGAAQAANTAGQATLGLATPGLNSAITKLTQQINTPPAYMAGAADQLGKTINGDYLSGSPETSHLADLIAQKTGAQYNSTFGAAGRGHGGLAALLSGQGVGDALSGFYADQYNRERQNQLQAAIAAPSFHQGENADIGALLAATQGAAMLPGQIAGQYGNTVTGISSPYVQNVTTQKTGGLGQVLSTGLGLAAMAAAPFTGGLSAGLGAGLGGAAGGLGGLLMNQGASALTAPFSMATPFSRFLG